MNDKPRLFGIERSNRDYTVADTWKNQFNSSFPASLACYLHSKGMKAVYIKSEARYEKDLQYIGIDELYGIDPLGDDIFFRLKHNIHHFKNMLLGRFPETIWLFCLMGNASAV